MPKDQETESILSELKNHDYLSFLQKLFQKVIIPKPDSIRFPARWTLPEISQAKSFVSLSYLFQCLIFWRIICFYYSGWNDFLPRLFVTLEKTVYCLPEDKLHAYFFHSPIFRASSAATSSASCLEGPVPWPTSFSPTNTPITKILLWSGPDSLITR